MSEQQVVSLFFFLLVSYLLHQCRSEDYCYPKQCPKINPIKELDYTKYQGRYYAIWGPQLGLKCLMFDRLMTGKGQFNVTINALTDDNKPQTMVVQTEFRNAKEPDSMYQAIYNGFPIKDNEFFLATNDDPTNGYILSYGCVLDGTKRTDLFFAGSRKTTLPAQILNDTLKRNGLTGLQLNGPNSPESCSNWPRS